MLTTTKTSSSRRTFLKALALGSAAGVILNSIPSVMSAEPDSRTFSVPLSAVSRISEAGAGMALEAGGRQVILVRSSPDRIAAFEPAFAGQKCPLTYETAIRNGQLLIRMPH